MHIVKLRPRRFLFIILILLSALFTQGQAQNQQDTLRLFLIGNSFSQNATRYLPQLAEAGKHILIIGRAELGGCSLQRHWELADAAMQNPEGEKGKAYKGKSLRTLLAEEKWDIVSIQQNSMNSGDSTTYLPYAQKLHALIKEIQPEAQIVFHQTWAYRTDSRDFTRISSNAYASNSKEMWQQSRAAYHAIAQKLNTPIVPVGDAFWQVSTHKKWQFWPDPAFNHQQAISPQLPSERNSLHVGYYWNHEQKLGFDSHHANAAGCYLGSLVWYSFLFGESPKKLDFLPQEVSADFDKFLKKTASRTVKKN